ncbi:MAG: Trm112 family protein [Gammaproteobacteria bacterium]|nr:Trm112 family protein [Gammaproteobacteria bacterium]
MEKKLLDILVCPETKGPLVYKVERDELWSVEARLAYAVKDDIPVLIAADARSLSDEELKGLEAS